MKRFFADSFYFFALLNPKDKAHARALAISESTGVALVTTAWVLTEVADGLCNSKSRGRFRLIWEELNSGSGDVVVEPTGILFRQGISLYNDRPDKNWSLTDCISFVVMEDYGLSEALTGDHHFAQAGFKALLLPDQ